MFYNHTVRIPVHIFVNLSWRDSVDDLCNIFARDMQVCLLIPNIRYTLYLNSIRRAVIGGYVNYIAGTL